MGLKTSKRSRPDAAYITECIAEAQEAAVSDVSEYHPLIGSATGLAAFKLCAVADGSDHDEFG
jgi:hypothetical protein